MEQGEKDSGSVSKAFRDFWAASQDEQDQHPLEEKLLKMVPCGILAGIAFFLALVIGLGSFMIYKRSEAGMASLLAGKGSSLLHVFESAVRIGMRTPSGVHIQALLDEISREPDIEFVAIVMPDGTIIAHSNEDRLGEIMRFESMDLNLERMAELDPAEDEKWLITQVEGRRVFLIYRHFTMGNKNWPEDLPEPTIFLGLEVSPFEITNSQNRSFVAILSIVTMLLVLCGLLAVSLAQRALESRRLQHDAEREVHRLEKKVRRNEKLAAIGTLAAGVAHEIRNPLSSIKGYATYFLQTSPEGGEARQAAKVMVAEVDRLNRVITDLLGLSKPDDVKLKPVRIDYAVDHARRLLRHNALQRNVKIVSRMAPHVPIVAGDIERLSQALLNICLNSIEAMPDGGILEIAVSGGKKRICVMTRDRGSGIAPDIMPRIFDPYFTTKGSGTGLGLPMAHKIVKAHGGSMEVYSRQGTENEAGLTIFRIMLPVWEDSSRPGKDEGGV